jgi:hypothetical protein
MYEEAYDKVVDRRLPVTFACRTCLENPHNYKAGEVAYVAVVVEGNHQSTNIGYYKQIPKFCVINVYLCEKYY